MIQIKIEEKEKLKTLAVVNTLKKKPIISIAMIARNASINSGRMRFIIETLVDEGRLNRIPVRNDNDRYKRYKYEVVK